MSKELPPSFHPEIYRLLNQDLKHLTVDELTKHFIERCETEKRFYLVEVFVICGGKCGSTTLEKTFKHNGYATIRTHGFEEFKTRNLCALTLYEVLDHHIKHGVEVLVIDSYRTPIERKMSSFFHNLNRHVDGVLSVDELIKLFNEKFIYSLENYHPINIIFERYGVEKFVEFDSSVGYNERVVGNVRYVKVKFCDIGKWNEVLSNIMGKRVSIVADNLTKNRSYYELYCEFKMKYVLNEDYFRDYVCADVEYKIYANNLL